MSDKVKHWLDLCNDDILTAKALLEKERFLHMGFFCHLIAEKSLKAVISSQTDDPPPKIHNLITLAERADIIDELSEKQLNLLEQLNPLNIEARYPEQKNKIYETLSLDTCKRIYHETELFLCWIKKKLDR